jgi:hypothetical protein
MREEYILVQQLATEVKKLNRVKKMNKKIMFGIMFLLFVGGVLAGIMYKEIIADKFKGQEYLILDNDEYISIIANIDPEGNILRIGNEEYTINLDNHDLIIHSLNLDNDAFLCINPDGRVFSSIAPCQ